MTKTFRAGAFGGLILAAVAAYAQSANGSLADLQAILGRVQTIAAKGDFAAAENEFTAFEAKWDRVEVNVKRSSKRAYRDIEAGMDDVKIALRSKTASRAQGAITQLGEILKRNRAALP